MSSKLTVTLAVDRFAPHLDRTVCIDLPYDLIREITVPVNVSPASVDFNSRLLFSHESEKRTRVLRSRQQLAERLVPQITKALLDVLGAQDTEKGYPKG